MLFRSFADLLELSVSIEVAITGVGVASAVGVGIDRFYSALLEGRSGIVAQPELPENGIPIKFAAPVAGFDGKDYVQPRKALKVMSKEIQWGYATAGMAMAQAGLRKGEYDPTRLGAVFGGEMIYGDLEELEGVYRHCMASGEFDFSQWGHHAMHDLFPLWMLKYLPNMTACHLGIAHDAQGPVNTVIGGDLAGLQALMEGCRYIERGHADAVIVGGSGSYLSATSMAFCGYSHLSQWNGPTGGAVRPYDLDRSGMVSGEGAASFVLERADFVAKRGAKPLAFIRGYAAGFQRQLHNDYPVAQALPRVITQALRNAKTSVSDLDHVNAHGLGGVIEDRDEAIALKSVVAGVPVTAIKSYIGHCGAGSSAVELAASLLALERGQLPRTINCERLDPACPINVVRETNKPVEKKTALVVNYSPRGQSAAVVIAKPQ